jgi:hypothetical protein
MLSMVAKRSPLKGRRELASRSNAPFMNILLSGSRRHLQKQHEESDLEPYEAPARGVSPLGDHKATDEK